MVGFIFGIIVLMAGIITGICFVAYKKTTKTEEYMLDENGEKIPHIKPLQSFGRVMLNLDESISNNPIE